MIRNLLTISTLCIFSFTVNAQNSPADTLKPASNTIPAPSDSSKVSSDSTDAGDDSNDDDEQNDDHLEGINLFRYRIDVSGIFTTGNVSRSLLQIATNFDWDVHKKLRLSTSPSFVYGTQNSVLAEREFFEDIRLNYLHERRFYYLSFGSYERSNLRQINFRWISAAGVGFKIINKKNAYLSITDVLLYENTDFISDALKDRDLWRNSTRISGEYHIDNNKLVLRHVLFLQPAITEDNFRWSGSISLAYKLSKSISLKTTLENSYESLVVLGRKNNDTRLTFGIEWERKK